MNVISCCEFNEHIHFMKNSMYVHTCESRLLSISSCEVSLLVVQAASLDKDPEDAVPAVLLQ